MIDLTGKWRYETSDGQGEFIVPGSNVDNGIGEKFVYDGTLSEANVKRLRAKRSYQGEIFLKREIEIPNYDKTLAYKLVLERVMWQSSVWINGHFVSSISFLSTSHEYDITAYMSEKIEIVICVDNRNIHHIHTTPSAYTEETQTIWNGIIGKCYIETSPFVKQEMQFIPHAKEKKVVIKYDYRCLPIVDLLSLIITVAKDHQICGQLRQENLALTAAGQFELQLEDVDFWDEFDPQIYTITCEFYAKEKLLSTITKQIGFRSWSSVDSQLFINEQPAFLRGTIDCCIFPQTGYPPMDQESWHKIFKTIKAHGLNHVRFHSWTPPEAAFLVADELGLYLQAEASIWLDDWMGFMLGDHPAHETYFKAESIDIIKKYGHHPSFCIFSCGNEIRGNFDILRDIIKEVRGINDQLLYTLTSNWDREIDEEDDLFISQTVDQAHVRGQYDLDAMVEATTMVFTTGINRRNVPVISHEIGQYAVYPNLKEIDKYTGLLEPVNFVAIKDDLIRKDMLSYADDFTYASGRLAFALYKDEIEAALRTEKMGGYQLLGLNDFTGQSTATVGLLDAFWEEKGLMEVSEYTQASAPLVPLAVMEKRIYAHDEQVNINIIIANYFKPLTDVTVTWQVKNDEKLLLEQGILCPNLAMGLSDVKYVASFNLEQIITQHTAVVFEIVLQTAAKETFTNSWDLWFFKEKPVDNTVLTCETLTDELLARVASGENLLWQPQKKTIKDAENTRFFPVFWSPVHFKSKDNCGFLIHDQHQLFQQFPSKNYPTYQWKNLVEDAFSMPFDHLSGDFSPLVQTVPNFFNHKKMFVLGEFRYGKGGIIMSSLNLNDDQMPAKALKESIFHYMSSSNFEPRTVITKEQIFDMYDEAGYEKEKIDLATTGICQADSEKSEKFKAQAAVDGDLFTCWRPVDDKPGHWWVIDLQSVKEIKGLEVTLLSIGTYYCGISVSQDDETYMSIASKIIDTKKGLTFYEDIDKQARYVRISYGDVSENARVGHSSVKVF